MKNETHAITRIKRCLASILRIAPTLNQAKGAGRVFELYVMMRLAKKLKDEGWTVEPLASDGYPLLVPSIPPATVHARPFTQRGGKPTGIIPTIHANGASSIKIGRSGKSYEIVNGVKFQGRSLATHELDIAIIPHQIAVALRAGVLEGFPYGRPQVSIECKDVVGNGTPDEMRSVIARMYDLTILEVHLGPFKLQDGFIFDSPTGACAVPSAPKTYLVSNRASLSVLARRGGISKGASDMTGLFKILPYIDVEHNSSAANVLVDEMADWIGNHL